MPPHAARSADANLAPFAAQTPASLLEAWARRWVDKLLSVRFGRDKAEAILAEMERRGLTYAMVSRAERRGYEAGRAYREDRLGEYACHTKAGEAAAWLRAELAEAPRAVGELERSARQMAFSWRTVERAKRSLGVQCEKRGAGSGSSSWWSLPDGE